MIRKEESNLVLTLGSSFVYAILLAALFFFLRRWADLVGFPWFVPLAYLWSTFQ